jgi:hypothetical protein
MSVQETKNIEVQAAVYLVYKKQPCDKLHNTQTIHLDLPCNSHANLENLHITSS